MSAVGKTVNQEDSWGSIFLELGLSASTAAISWGLFSSTDGDETVEKVSKFGTIAIAAATGFHALTRVCSQTKKDWKKLTKWMRSDNVNARRIQRGVGLSLFGLAGFVNNSYLGAMVGALGVVIGNADLLLNDGSSSRSRSSDSSRREPPPSNNGSKKAFPSSRNVNLSEEESSSYDSSPESSPRSRRRQRAFHRQSDYQEQSSFERVNQNQFPSRGSLPLRGNRMGGSTASSMPRLPNCFTKQVNRAVSFQILDHNNRRPTQYAVKSISDVMKVVASLYEGDRRSEEYKKLVKALLYYNPELIDEVLRINGLEGIHTTEYPTLGVLLQDAATAAKNQQQHQANNNRQHQANNNRPQLPHLNNISNGCQSE